jgi:RNA polymerase sigma-70 factor (ECF subfamily)
LNDPTQERALQQRFREIYEANYAPLGAYALRRCATAEDAADVVAETFAIAWRRIRQVPAERDATLWLFGTARKVLANQRRGERRRARLSLRLKAEPAVEDAGAQERAGELELAKGALQRISPAQRDLLGLVAWEGLSTAELAAVLGCSENAAKIRLHRARRALAVEMERALAVGKPAPGSGQEMSAIPKTSPIAGETR